MAVDEKGLGTFHEFTGYFGGSRSRVEDACDFFVGRFKVDNQYHLMGHRPKDCAYLFSAASESRSDLGVVGLPKGKQKLKELVEGDILSVAPNRQDVPPYEIVFIQFN